MDLGLKGKTALVTASSRGIGRAIAAGLAAEGCEVVICSRDHKKCAITAIQIQDQGGGEIVPLQVDLRDKESIDRLLEQLDERVPPIDILINNTGGMPYKRHHELSHHDWQASFDLTFMSQVHLAEALLRGMRKRAWGRIIFVTSVAAKQPGMLIAHSQRAAVAAYAKTLANEVSADNVLVNSICPSFALTTKYHEVADEVARRHGASREEIEAQWMKTVPMGRPAAPSEIADLAVFLASERSSYITGNSIQVDGGFTRGLT